MNETALIERQCSATNRQGSRCGRYPIPGGNVCGLHGGNIPAVRRAAKERLIAMLEPALNTLHRAMQTALCPTCGRGGDPAVAVRAAIAVLDRTGFVPGITVQVEDRKEQTDENQSITKYLTKQEMLRYAELASELQSLWSAGRARRDREVIDVSSTRGANPAEDMHPSKVDEPKS